MRVKQHIPLLTLDYHVHRRQAYPDTDQLHKFELVAGWEHRFGRDELAQDTTEGPHVCLLVVRQTHNDFWTPVETTLHIFKTFSIVEA